MLVRNVVMPTLAYLGEKAWEGFLGNRADALTHVLLKKSTRALLRNIQRGRPDENHDVEKALVDSLLETHQTLMLACEKRGSMLPFADRWVQKLEAQLCKRSNCQRWIAEHFVADDPDAVLNPQALTQLGAMTAPVPALQQALASRVHAEVQRLNLEPGDWFQKLVDQGWRESGQQPDPINLGHLFALNFRQKIKHRPEVSRMLVMDALAELRARPAAAEAAEAAIPESLLNHLEEALQGQVAQRQMLEALDGLLGELPQRLDALEAELKSQGQSLEQITPALLSLAVVQESVRVEIQQGFRANEAMHRQTHDRLAALEALLLANVVPQIAREEAVPVAMLEAVLQAFGEAMPLGGYEQAEKLLRDKAQQYHEYRQRLAELTDEHPEAAALILRVQSHLERGEFDAADGCLVELEGLQDRQLQAAAALLSVRAAAAAETLGQRAGLAELRLRYLEAAVLHKKAAALPGLSDALRRDARQRALLVLIKQGEEFGDNQALGEAVALGQSLLAQSDRETVPLDWAATQNNLGNALRSLGAREPGTARLEEAVAAYRAALQERTQARVPLDWAATQNNLGNALQTLGARESGTARLEEAVAAYRAALQERTQARVPLNWAGTQNNLGTALSSLGERESGTARLEEAVAAFRAALEEYTQARVPLYWAANQNNLGNALRSLGAREPGTARLEEAVAAYRAALEEYTQARVPLNWAMTQNNLGNALQSLGEREPGTARLEAAVAAYRAALQERTQARVPLDWAMTQNNLGSALQTLGEREPGTARLEAAVAAFRAALEEYTQARVPLNWAGTQNNLGTALSSLGERESGTARLEAAVAAFRAALAVFEAAGAAYYITLCRNNLAAAEALLARRRTGG